METQTLNPTQTIDRGAVASRLLALPLLIADAEVQLLAAECNRRRADAALQEAEDRLLLAGGIDGKNAETRAAQLREGTHEERITVEMETDRTARLKARLHALQTEHSSLRSVARLLAGAE